MIRAALRDLLKRKRGRIWCLLPCKVHILPPVPCLLSKNSSPSPIRQAGAGSGLEAAGLEAAGPEQRGNNRRRCERGQSVHEPAAADKQYVHAVKTPCDVLMFYSNDGSVLILIWLSAFWQSRLVSSLHQRAGESLLWYILQEGRIKNQQWTSEAFISSQTRLLVLLLLTFKGPVCRIKTICWQRYMLPWSRSSSTESAMFLQEPRIDWNDPRGQIKYFALEKKKKRYWQNRTLALKRASLFEFLQLQRSV